MALRLDLTHVEFGYFYSANWDDVKEYIMQLMLIKNCSIILNAHASAEFERDNEVVDMHMRTQPSLILDPQQPEDLIDHLLDNHHGLMHDLENYEDFESSDWNLVPGTFKYWIKVYPCQPNPDGEPTSQNSMDNDHDPDDSDSERSRSPHQQLNDLVGAIATYFYPGKLRREVLLRERQLELFIKDDDTCEYLRDYMYMPKFRLDNLANWHQRDLKYLNIRVFSLRGNVLYAKKMEPDSDEWINLYLNSNNRFAYIVKLNAFFGKGLDRVLCEDCNTWHRNQSSCKLKICTPTDEDLTLPRIPEGRHGLVCYADFESIIESETNKHVTSGFSFLAIDRGGKVFMDYTQSALQIQSESLINDFLILAFICANDYIKKQRQTNNAGCRICGEEIELGEPHIRARNFINGMYGMHHKECWADNKNSMYIFFHNFRGYDSHFLMEEICTKYDVIAMQASSMEKFNLITLCKKDEPKVKITFKDTYNFFTCSLAKCVSMVEEWKYTEPEYRNSKGIFPYEWFDSYLKLADTELPPGPWVSKLSGQSVDSAPAQKVWQDEQFTCFEEYHNFYCRLDTLQLCDVFEEFRRTCIKEFNIDPVHFQGAPALTWFLGLRSNQEMFKIIMDGKVYLDIQGQIRGGISQAMMRYCKPEANESIIFLDVNSLYSKCMTYKLPGKYIKKLDNLPMNWRELYGPDSNRTLLVNVDLEYPAYLHDRDWAYPLAPHKFNERLCTTFLPKNNYLTHVELLDFYLERGLIIVKVNYCYEFEQDYTLRDYVDNNIKKRIETKSEVMKTLYKLLNNSLYGKTCENVFKYRKFEVQDQEEMNSGQVNPTLYKAKNMIDFGDVFLCEMPVDQVKLNKPIQIGFAILEFAKREIYKFLSVVIDEFGNDVTPLYTDTDSIMFHCKFDKPWEKFYNSNKIRPLLDFDKVPEEWGVRTPGTNKVSGLWSPEADGKTITEYVGLRAKCYSYQFEDKSIVVKNKGVPKAALISDNENPDRKITFQDYKDALFLSKELKVAYYNIRSNKHEVNTKRLYKLGISGNDLKRTVLSDRIHSLPFGYLGSLFKTNDADDPDLIEQWHLPLD